ncbi:MAG: nuclear transport factor 2 family protein [Kofleriaceae bacterium]|nr:nuclear transport factor 2 family protein [Kofleriaceae bacterium]
MRIVRSLVVVAILAGCAGTKAPPTVAVAALDGNAEVAALATVERWRQAMEVRSLDGLAGVYANDRRLVVVDQGQRQNGWSIVEPALRDMLARVREVHLKLSELTAQPYGTSMLVHGAMAREISDGATTVTEAGILTLILERDSGAWRIVAQHFSYRSR